MFGDMKQLSLKMIKSLRPHLQASIRVPAFPSEVLPQGGFIPALKNCSSAAGVDLWWSANHRMKWFRATSLSPTRGTEGVVKTIERSGSLFFPEGRRPRWEVDPPLRVREDWWVFERLLRVREDWWVFERAFFNGKEGRVDFRKNLSSQEFTF